MKRIVKSLNRYKKDILVVSIGQLLAALGTLVGVRILTEYISPGVFGTYKLSFAGISLVSAILVRPIIQFAMRELHDAKKLGAMASYIVQIRGLLFRVIFIVSLIIGAASYILTYYITNLSLVFTAIILLLLAAQSSVEFERAIAVTRNKQVVASIVSVAQSWTVPVIIVAVVAVTNESIFSMLLAAVAVLGIINLCQRISQRSGESQSVESLPYMSMGELSKTAFKYGRPLAIVGILSWIIHESDRFLLLYYHSKEVVGIYSAAYGLVAAPFTLVVGSMAQFLYPIVFNASVENKKARKIYALKSMLFTSTFISVIGILLVLFLGEQIAWVALGAQYRVQAVELLLWVAIGYGCLAISMSFDLAAYGDKRTSDLLIASSISSALNLIMNLILIPEYGALGAAISTMTALICYLIVMSLLYYWHNKEYFHKEI